MKKGTLIALFLIFSIGIVTSASFGYDNPTLPKLVEDLFGGKTSDFYMPNNKTNFGNFSWGGTCLDGGVEIRDGGLICGQRLEIFNITSVNVTKQNVTVTDNFIVLGNISAFNLFGDLVGNTSAWTRTANNIFPTVISSQVGVGVIPISMFHVLGNSFFDGDVNISGNLGGGSPLTVVGGLEVDTKVLFSETATGFVGVNTTTPQNTVNIVGDLNVTGDMFLDGNFSGNLLYGEMYQVFPTGNTILINTLNIYENATNMTAGLNNGFSLKSNNVSLITSEAGIYRISYSISFTGGSNSPTGIAIGIGGVEQTNTYTARTTGVGGATGNVAGTGIISLDVNDEVTLMVRDEANPLQDIVIVSANINLERVGT